MTEQAIGFTLAGGTTSKTLTVPLDASVSGTNTGDQDITGKLNIDQTSPQTTVGKFRFPYIGAGKTNDGNAYIEALTKTADSIQGFRVENDNATNLPFSTFVTGDNFLRYSFLGDGTMKWGAGATVADTNLYRSAANVLKTDDDFIANNIASGASVSGTNTGDNAANSTSLPLAGGTMTGTITLRTGAATAGVEPIKFVAGTVNTTPVAGVIEFDGTDYYFSS
jgi:hypothetical protein